MCWITRVISSAKPLCEKYREGNNLSPLPSWGNSEHHRIKSLVSLEIVSWSPTSYPQLVCCCCGDLWTPFCWGLRAVVPALLPWAGCIAPCGALWVPVACASNNVFARKQAAAKGSPYPYDLHRSYCFTGPASPSLLICLRMPPSWDFKQPSYASLFPEDDKVG